MYKNKTLSFIVTNTIGDPFDVLVVKSGNTSKEEPIVSLITGASQDVDMQMDLADAVVMFPKGCERHNKKIFNVRTLT